jgi:hypothetical protein
MPSVSRIILGSTMSFWTWSPFQSLEVREICRHMTSAELDRAVNRSMAYGVWVFVSVVVPFRVFTNSSAWWAWGAAGLLLVGHVAFLPAWVRSNRRFLLSTEWARSQGYPKDLRLFQFRRTG